MYDPTERLLRRIETAWTELVDSYSGLSEAELMEPGVMGPWSVKDILGHVSTWEEEALKHLPTIIQGGRPPMYKDVGGIDSFNDRMAERKRSLSLREVLKQRDQTHQALLEFVRDTPIDKISGRSRFLRRLRLDAYGHYAIHSEAIRAWRGQP